MAGSDRVNKGEKLMETVVEDRTQYIEAAKLAAWPDWQGECEECSKRAGRKPRLVIHSYRGGLGADWDLDAVIDLIETASDVCWIGEDGCDDTLSQLIARANQHELRVREYDGSTIYFAVPKP